MKRTAFVYDPFNLRHTLEGHPENYRRLETTWNLLQKDGILESLIRLPSSEAPFEIITSVHSPYYIERLESATMLGRAHLDPDTYVNEDSHKPRCWLQAVCSISWMRC